MASSLYKVSFRIVIQTGMTKLVTKTLEISTEYMRYLPTLTRQMIDLIDYFPWWNLTRVKPWVSVTETEW